MVVSAGASVWHVYLLECADGTLYCGVTNNLAKRVQQHNGVIPGGARYTKGRRPVRMLTSRACTCRRSALLLERVVKASPRAAKRDFLQNGDSRAC
ncbi:MAG: GIY-YIG nuclease family protein [Desulfovibrio sp.]|jgi:putative endonuclease|nr:GIY-YIG nuclease family protein [Desulfovibrio sp.]